MATKKGYKDFQGAMILMHFAATQGYPVRYTGLCVWAQPETRRKNSKADKLMREAGFTWSEKKQAYFCRALPDAQGLPTCKEVYKTFGLSDKAYRAKRYYKLTTAA